MACEKYSRSITRAALGGLSPAQHAELRAHVSQCGACGAEWKTAVALAAAVDGAVTALVAGEPSPQFTARLRARIAEDPAPSAWRWFTWPQASIATAVAAVVLVTVVVMRAPQQSKLVTGVASVPEAAAPPPVTTAARSAPAAAPRATNVASREVASPFVNPEVLVPRGQLAAAFRVSDGLNRGEIGGAQLSKLAELDAQAGKPLEVKAIEIKPLTVPGLSGVVSDADEDPSAQGRQ